ncbi:MAG TPA: trypsin-like peptidase domain-containing protein [Candidatus Aquilonibacter sp.]|jgi:serine protease Do|nr:trypsin-like peptidase domain-containing protein [Candidatus Aquilonibacter sp.]
MLVLLTYRAYAGRRSRLFLCLVALFLSSTTSLMSQQSPGQNPGNPTPATNLPEGRSTEEKTQPRPDESASASAALVQLNNALEGLAAKVSPAVVQILVTGYAPLHEENRSQTALIVRQQAVGSGVIVDPSGYIMTNAHVVEGAQRIRVALPLPGDSGRAVPVGKRHILEAHLVGVHKDTDLALLKIDEKDLPTLPLLAQQRARVGQLVFAIGSPEGLQNSVTMGVVSAVARQPDPEKPLTYIQTDAPINPGNSGGPLVDMNGSVVGINTFILSEGGGSEGLGFAIPARIVDFVYHSLRKYGHVHKVEIGAVAQEITPTMADGLQLAQRWGVIVADVKPDGPAAAAGMQVQDIVLTADDRRIETLPQLSSALYLHRLDQVLKLEILRGEEKKILYVPAIEQRDPMDQLFDAADPEKSLVPRLGILATNLTSGLRNQIGSLRIPSGVIVLGRAADLITPETGLQTGDVIHALNTTRITSMDDLRAGVQALKKGDAVVLQVERSDGLSYLSFEME